MAFTPVYPIETQRLRLRPFTRGDVDAVHDYRRRDDVTRYLYDEPMSRESCTEAVQTRIGQISIENDDDRLFLAVERQDDLAVLGEVCLILRSASSRQAELGYTFNPVFHGRGYATEAALALLAIGFEAAGMHRIYARCHALNAASRRVMERLGMRQEAHLREHLFVKGAWDEELIYALLEDEWRARQATEQNTL